MADVPSGSVAMPGIGKERRPWGFWFFEGRQICMMFSRI